MTRVVVLPDIHTPNHNVDAINAVLEFIKFYKPHYLIQLGDFCDWDSVSTFLPRSERDLITINDEADSANELLDVIDDVCKKSGVKNKVMIGGNHEDRYAKYRVNHGMHVSSRRMKTFTSWEKEYELDRRGWQHFDYGQSFHLGKIVFTHGWKNNNASRMSQLFPGKNVIFGHLHRHEVHGLMDERGLPIETETIGTLSNMNLSYMMGEPTIRWVHGFMYIDMMDNGNFSKHFVHVIEGKFIEFGRQFNGC